MKFFYDFEFNEDGVEIRPISLGVTSLGGDFELYFVDKDYVERQYNRKTRNCNYWVLSNVIPYVYQVDIPIIECAKDKWGDLLEKALVEKFPHERWEFVGYYSSHDYVALAQLWGKMVEMPPGMPMWTRDIKQWVDDLGNPKIEIAKPTEHNAIADARWNRDTYLWLSNNFSHPAWSQ